jgi:ubiquinone biosynthesis monooxygenase Coq7
MSSARPAGHRLPGDRPSAKAVEAIIRVDQAGEFGATRIYDGQLAVLRRGPAAEAVRHMAEQEKHHRAVFDAMIPARRVRPTLLSPLWHVAGYALGAATALMGEKAAMACTVAVEEVIDDHYRHQAESLGNSEPALKAVIEEFRAEELEHRELGLAHGATETPGYEALKLVVKTGSKLAIWLSARI